jgi:hypothetical protein
MTTTFTWAIANLERETADGFVYTAHYTVNATDGEAYSAGAYGSIGFERPEELIPFDDLTPEIVIEWTKQKLGEEQVEKVETALQSQIDEKRAPTKASGTPW